jgi:Zn-dependent M28 family amino/carboxypeptidase
VEIERVAAGGRITKAKAATREFEPVPLGTTASVSLVNTIRKVSSANVTAKLEGSDQAIKDEWVIYTTHWDHFGLGPAVNGDTILFPYRPQERFDGDVPTIVGQTR